MLKALGLQARPALWYYVRSAILQGFFAQRVSFATFSERYFFGSCPKICLVGLGCVNMIWMDDVCNSLPRVNKNNLKASPKQRAAGSIFYDMIKNLPNEEWKPVPGWETRYLVSNMGRVQSLPKHKLLKVGQNKKGGGGYLRLNAHLCSGGVHTQKNFYIHRLVASLFIPNPDGKSEVNHIDEDITNNVWTNLEWTTHIENTNWGTRNKRISTTLRRKSLV